MSLHLNHEGVTTWRKEVESAQKRVLRLLREEGENFGAKNGCVIALACAMCCCGIPTGEYRTMPRRSDDPEARVKKWRKRLREADPHDAQVLVSRSRAHHAPYPSWDPRVEERIVEMRSSPPENLKRVPGPRALLYYLPRDEELQALQLPLPCSSRTVWKILHKHGCILERPMRKQTASGAKSTPRRDSDGRAKTSVRCPAVKVRRASGNTLWRSATRVDAGTSILLSAQAREDFHAQTAMQTVIDFLREHGRPPMMTFDRDPRWVGSSSGRDFPSALRRLLLCLGIHPHVCPPHRPDKNDLVAYCTPFVR